MLVLEELFFHSHAVAITGSPASASNCQSLPNDEVLQGIAGKILSGFDVQGTTETVVMDLPSASTSPQSAGLAVAEATQTVTLKVVANMLSASFKIVRQFIEDEQSLAKKSQHITVFLRPKAFIDHDLIEMKANPKAPHVYVTR